MEKKKSDSPLNNILPTDLCNKIEDMVCKKVINGDKASNELLLIFEVNKTAKDVHDEVIHWMLQCLDTISDKVMRGGTQYEWNIVSNIKDNDWVDEEDNNRVLNTIVVAIHLPGNLPLTLYDDVLVSYNLTAEYVLSPQEIMDCLIREPEYVKKIGISAVSSDVMMQWWDDIISEELYSFDIAGRGYMQHPMWMKFVDEGWHTIREKSFNFGWKNYRKD